MPRLRKFIFHNHVHFITCSVEEGIMLPANPLVSFLIKSAMLRATELHPVTISHFIVNGTHIHMIIRVKNPEDIPGFMERFKTESAHYLNRLLGRAKRTIWCSGYDSPRLCNIEDVKEKITYLYINPVKDGLISHIAEYPGLSSWGIYQSSQARLTTRLIGRDSVFEVGQEIQYKGFKKALKRLKACKSTGGLKSLPVSPNDWMEAFSIRDKAEQEQINKEVKREIALVEAEIQEERKGFVGKVTLINQGIELDYRPKRAGRKMWCICRNKEQRKSYIGYLKALANEARYIYEQWKLGATYLRMPQGVFAPRVPVVCNVIA